MIAAALIGIVLFALAFWLGAGALLLWALSVFELADFTWAKAGATGVSLWLITIFLGAVLRR